MVLASKIGQYDDVAIFWDFRMGITLKTHFLLCDTYSRVSLVSTFYMQCTLLGFQLEKVELCIYCHSYRPVCCVFLAVRGYSSGAGPSLGTNS
jgi:hypothetical protein